MLTALHNMSQQESQYTQTLVPRSKFSSTKVTVTSDAACIDTPYAPGIVMDLSGTEIPKELTPVTDREWLSPQLNDKEVNTLIETAKELAYNPGGPTNKILRTSTFPLGYGSLVAGGNTQ